MNIFEDLFFCVAGVYTFMSLWNTLVVSFLKTFEIKRENENLKSPLSEIPFSLSPLHLQLLLSLSCGPSLLPIRKKLRNSCSVFSFVCDGFVSDLAFVPFPGLCFPSFRQVYCCVWPPQRSLHWCSLVVGCGSLSGCDWRLERECACFNWCDQIGEGPNYMNVLKWNL